MNTLAKQHYLSKIAINKSLLKEYHSIKYNRIVYIKNDKEFQIQLFNPYTYSISCKISINGIEQLNKLVIRPGERIWLDRYLDTNNKFLYSTYTIDNSIEAKNATELNGIISISFYREKQNKDIYCVYTGNFYYDNYNGLDTYTINNDAYTYTTTTKTPEYSENTSCTFSCLNNSSIDTGRVEKGNMSNQKFINTLDDFEIYPFTTEVIKLLPYSNKPYDKSDLQKIYCTNCGRKLNTKFKYCPYCGEKVSRI